MAVSGDPIRVQDEGGRTAASAVTGSDGRFRLLLPPGTYRITESICTVGQRVQVGAGVTVSVTLRMLPGAC
jgi:hypothetical protein